MKHWKEWSFWSRGATIAFVICLLFILFQTVLIPKFFYGQCGEGYCVSSFAAVIQNIFYVTLIPLLNSVAANYFFESPILLYVSTMIYYVIVGAFLGLMYGKVRHGKNTIHPPKTDSTGPVAN